MSSHLNMSQQHESGSSGRGLLAFIVIYLCTFRAVKPFYETVPLPYLPFTIVSGELHRLMSYAIHIYVR